MALPIVQLRPAANALRLNSAVISDKITEVLWDMSSPNIDTTDSFSTPESTEDQETGLEPEPSEPNQITDPFDPEQIKIRTVYVLIEQLVTRIKYKEIDLTPDFQRLRGDLEQ